MYKCYYFTGHNRMGEASMKHIRIEVAKKCTEKIKQVH